MIPIWFRWCLTLVLIAGGLEPVQSQTLLRQPDGSGRAGCADRTLRAGTSSTPSVADDSLDVLFYRLELVLSPPTQEIRGRVRMVVRVLADTVTTVAVDLASPMQIDTVLMSGMALSFVRFPASYLVRLPQPCRQGEILSITTVYHGQPIPTGFGSFVFETSDGSPWIWSLSQPYGARDWWPCRDHPLDKADSVDILVTTATNLKVGSNGRLVGIIEAGSGLHTYHWQSRYPIATYLVSVAVGPYTEFSDWFVTGGADSLQILNYVLPGSVAEFQPALAKAVGMLEIFTPLFGPYPFLREKYGHSQFGIGGAMEHQTMTSTTTPEEDVLAHELAHQWFGDMITCASWQHLWLNEGFATYSEALYRERAYGPAEYRRLIDDRMNLALGFPGTLFASDTSSVRQLFDVRGVYSKGASVLHMLRGVVGDSVFFRCLRTYAGDPHLQYGTATTEDFQRICQNVAGEGLDWFFRQWVYGENYPRYLITWETVPREGSTETTLRIQQQTRTTNPTFFTMPVELRVRGGSQDTTFRLWNDRQDQSWILQTSFPPTSVALDPDRWILREVLEESTLPLQIEVDQNFPNPFNAGTTISFRIPARARVVVRIFDLLGADVITLADKVFEPGQHALRWEGSDGAGVPVGSGPYFYRVTSGASQIIRSMMLLR